MFHFYGLRFKKHKRAWCLCPIIVSELLNYTKGDNLWYVYCCHLAHWCPSVHAHACTHTLHTLTCTLHAVSLDNKLLSFWKFSLSVRQLLSHKFWTFLWHFEHPQDSFQVFSVFGSFTVCYPSFSLLLSHSLVVGGMANRMGWWWGSRKVFWFWLVSYTIFAIY